MYYRKHKTKRKNDSQPERRYQEFGNRLIHVMNIRNISCKALAPILYTTPSALVGYRTGRRSPDVNMLRQLAKVLNVSADYLLGLSDEFSECPTLQQE